MKRRKFLKHVGHSLAVPGIVGSFGLSQASAHTMQKFLKMASEEGKVLVMIYLDGGNDGLNTVIPLDRLTELNAVRPHVMLPDSAMIPLEGTNVALHPALDGFASLYKENRLGIVQNVGYPGQNYSHFRSSDIWMSGSDADEVVNSGWMGRFLNETYEGYPEEFPNTEMPDPLAIEIGYGSSMLFQGQGSLMSMVLNNPDSFYNLLNEVEEDTPDSAAGDKLKFVRLVARQSQQYGQIVKNAAEQSSAQLEYPDTDLANQLKIVAKLISGGLKTPMYLVRLGGFDTHESQVSEEDKTTGRHTELLTELNDGIMAFMKDLENLGKDEEVLGMTFSEFGRRIISNASNGTDHGAAAPLFVFGNKVRGGVLGDNPVIDTGMTYEDNLEMQYDFRQVYASILEQWFGSDSVQINSLLFKDFETIPIIGDSITALEENFNQSLSVYPNPLNGQATIEFESNSAPVQVELIDANGKLVERIYRGYPKTKNMKLKWNTSTLITGRYFLIVRQKDNDQVFSVVKS